VKVTDATLFVSSHTGAVYHCSDVDYETNWLLDENGKDPFAEKAVNDLLAIMFGNEELL
jgi:hypothetical protein